MDLATNKIIEAFQLAKNPALKERDIAILEKLSCLCFEEVILFLEENLGGKKLEACGKELQASSKVSEQVDILAKYLETIPFGKFKLQARLNGFIENSLIKTLEKKKHNL